MCKNQCENHATFARFLLEFGEYSRLQGAADTRNTRGRKRAFCGAPWTPIALKKGGFWVQGPVFVFLRIFRDIVAFPTLTEGFFLAETVGVGTDICAIFAPI